MNDLHSNFAVSKSIESSMTITGEFVTDTLVIGDTTVEPMETGIPNVDAAQNIIGLGYGETNSSFISLTEALVDAGTIKSPACMYMGNPLHSTSTEVSQDEKQGKAFRVNMTSFSINETPVFPEGLSKQALLDPSLSYTYVPESIAQDIFSQLGATETPTSGPVSIPCNTTFSVTTLTFEFRAASFKLDIGLFVGTRSVFNEEDICYLGTVAKTDTKDANSVGLGASFLQQIYTVYTMGNNEISLAQRNWNSNEDEILEITFLIWALFCL
ncbi:hypothetical protein N7465_010069 [Penicillium sp. CMV-2018d]|nr:hypothetical protein N7465_010069 [Penicillium sp. CMV-2018d]